MDRPLARARSASGRGGPLRRWIELKYRAPTDLAVVYRASLQAPTAGVVAFGDVRAARIKGQDLLLEAMAMVIGRHHSGSPEDMAARSDLLGPILEQNDAIGVALKGRRSVVDVNPETGAADPSVLDPAEVQAASGGDSSGGKTP
jgi:hypothetical protein